MPLPDGGVAEVKLDFDVLRELGAIARAEYGLAGAVQHGASTLPDELFHRFPTVETAEIHLATGFQNALYEHPAFPAELHREIEAWCFANAADERKADQTDEQFVYTTRKKAIGPFKRQLWDLATKDEILAAQAAKFEFLFTELGVTRHARHGRTSTSGPSSCIGRCLTPWLKPSTRPGPDPTRGMTSAAEPGPERAPEPGRESDPEPARDLGPEPSPDAAREPAPDDAPRGALLDELTRAMHRVPELAGHDLRFTALSGGITNRNFLTEAAGLRDRYVVRLAGNDTHLLGISREVEHAATVAAAGVGVGPEVVAFIRPEGYLVTKFIVGGPVTDEAVHRPETIRRVADSIRRIHDGPAIPGLFIPFRIVEAYRALAMARGVTIPDAYEPATAIARRIEAAFVAEPVEIRPCHNDLLNANFIDDGDADPDLDWEYAGLGDPFFDLGNFSRQPRADARRGRHPARGVRGLSPSRAPGPDLPDADRVRLPRGDVGCPPAGDQHPRRGLRGLRRGAFRPTARERRGPGLRASPARRGRGVGTRPGREV